MRSALAAHDAVLRSAIEAQAAGSSSTPATGVRRVHSAAAAVPPPQERHLAPTPVRMESATGEAEEQGDDYLGPVLNRVARAMAAGHGGQILVAASTASLLTGVDLIDLGEHRLRTCPARSTSTRSSRTGWATRSRRCGRWTPRRAT